MAPLAKVDGDKAAAGLCYDVTGTMIKNPSAYLRTAEQARTRALRKMSVQERIRVGEDLIRALFSQGTPRSRRDRPRALAYYVKSGKRA